MAGAMHNTSARRANFDVGSQRKLWIAEMPLWNRPAGERLECRRADELTRRFGHHHGHAGAGLHQLAHQRRRLIGRDAAGHADENFAALHSSLEPRLKKTSEVGQIQLRRAAGPSSSSPVMRSLLSASR